MRNPTSRQGGVIMTLIFILPFIFLALIGRGEKKRAIREAAHVAAWRQAHRNDPPTSKAVLYVGGVIYINN